MISSGSLIITVKEKDSEKLLDELKRGKVDAMLIGEITEKGRNLEWVKRDELWKVLEK